MNNQELLPTLKRGDYINFDFGCCRENFYVLANFPDKKYIEIVMPSWLTTSGKVFTYDELAARKEIIYLGKGRFNWWRYLTFFFMPTIPIYSKP